MCNCSSKNIISVIIVSCFLFSCSKNTVYNEFQHISNKTWNRSDAYFFNFEIMDNSVAYNISLQLRNNDMYKYQNIWVIYEEAQPSGVAIKDTIEYMLADDFGKWTGNGISLYQNRIALRNAYHFPDTGKYTISVQHGMRDNELKGLENIGLFIEKNM